jgi:iron complex outermembrane receptor protein
MRRFLTATAAASAIIGAQAWTEAAHAAEQDPAARVSEIVVTAERRSERLEDVPISVTAIQADTLTAAGITSTRDLALVTPGLRIDAVGVYVAPSIRGISTLLTTPTASANVATYVDGVYQQTMLSAIYSLPDVQQIEVLKGPQGTLFGRNATGGAMLINTVSPSFSEARGQASLSYGRFNEIIGKGYVTAPINDKVAVGLAVFGEHYDGYKRDVLKGGARGGRVNDYLVRGKLRFLPWEGADFTLTALYGRRDDYDSLKYSNYDGNTIGRRFVPASLIADEPHEFSADAYGATKVRQKSVSLRGDIRLGPGTLTTTSAYSRSTFDVLLDSDNSPAPLARVAFPANTKSWTQELVYATDKIDRLHFVAGAFYFHNIGGFDPLNVNNFSSAIYTSDKSDAYAAFGTVTLDVTDQLSLTGGLRYSHERQIAKAALRVNTSAPPGALNPLGRKSWSSTTPRASVLYKLNDDANLYFTYSEGFKSGTFNTVSFQAAPIDPEKVTAYEVGIKGFLGRTFSYNGALFHYSYKDLQVPTIANAGGVQLLTNAATAKIKGAELNATWKATDQFSLTAGATYLHARYDKFPDASVIVPTGLGSNVTISRDVSGNVMIRSPTFSGNLTASYTVPTSSGDFEANGTLYYSSKVYFDVGDRIVQPAYATLNATLSWRPHDSGATFRLWGRNLTDHDVIFSTIISGTSDAVAYLPPRSFGVEVSYAY